MHTQYDAFWTERMQWDRDDNIIKRQVIHHYPSISGGGTAASRRGVWAEPPYAEDVGPVGLPRAPPLPDDLGGFAQRGGRESMRHPTAHDPDHPSLRVREVGRQREEMG